MKEENSQINGLNRKLIDQIDDFQGGDIFRQERSEAIERLRNKHHEQILEINMNHKAELELLREKLNSEKAEKCRDLEKENSDLEEKLRVY